MGAGGATLSGAVCAVVIFGAVSGSVVGGFAGAEVHSWEQSDPWWISEPCRDC